MTLHHVGDDCLPYGHRETYPFRKDGEIIPDLTSLEEITPIPTLDPKDQDAVFQEEEFLSKGMTHYCSHAEGYNPNTRTRYHVSTYGTCPQHHVHLCHGCFFKVNDSHDLCAKILSNPHRQFPSNTLDYWIQQGVTEAAS